ncbi:phage tail protein [Citrobacter braakii]
MSAKFYTLLTDIGAAKLASAAALGVPLKITHMAVGSGGGVLPTPNAQQTALVAEERRAALNMLYIDPQNSSQIIAEQVIPENEGGWWIREVGLFDETGALIAVGNCPESYKPKLAEGSGRTQTVRMVLITSSTDNITLKIDPAVVLATRKYVDDKVLELKVYVDDLMAKHVAANDPHTQYAPKASPTFTGTPKAPTAAAGNNSTQLANTAFVQAAIAALVASSPAALDTLNELAAALGNDPNFATTMTNALAGKMDKAANGKDIADVSEFLKNLGLGTAAKRNVDSGLIDGIPDMSSFRSLMIGNGYVRIPTIGGGGGAQSLIIQWGVHSTSPGSNAAYNLNIAFPTGILWATGGRGAPGSNAPMNVGPEGTQQIRIQNYAPGGVNENCFWLAIGY